MIEYEFNELIFLMSKKYFFLKNLKGTYNEYKEANKNFLEKNKTRMNRFDKNFLQNKNIMKEYDKLKKNYIKITSRLYSKKSQNNIKSNINPTIKENTISYKISSNLKTSKYKSVYNYKNK